MITSTITRPTSIAATSTCDQKVSLVETVDIGPLSPPKPRTISLEPITKRSKRKKAEKQRQLEAQQAAAAEIGPENEIVKAAGSPHPDDSISQCGDGESIANPRSPVPSEVLSMVSIATGTESTASSSTGLSFRLGPVPSSAKSRSQSGGIVESSASAVAKTISATIELQKSGCLPGESIPLKISIRHIKAIKSMHGIIITLYRQGRIDSAPPLSLFVDVKGKAAEKLKHEEYYPKSKTGLGGLSLSSAGSSSMFRKDLAQTFAPILVDPVTLTATIQASVRCPEDVFPTIKGVPGEMISFKYHIEVVVDLGGKLAGQQMHVPKVGSVTIPSGYGGQETIRDLNTNMIAAFGGSIVDTDHIRREKSVVACLFEVTVGSIDSARRRNNGKQSATHGWPGEIPVSPSFPHKPIYEDYLSYDHGRQPTRDGQSEYQYYDGNYNEPYSGYYNDNGYDHQSNYDQYNELSSNHPHMAIPPPEIQPVEELSEKERARLAEERLLPSRPPIDSSHRPSSSRTYISASGPSAPPGDNSDLYDADDHPPPLAPTVSNHTIAPSAPTLQDLAPNAGANPFDDKQELERQRMMAEASDPSDFMSTDEDHNGGEGSSGAQFEASAPILTEEDEYGGHYSNTGLPGPSYSEQAPRYSTAQLDALPKYER